MPLTLKNMINMTDFWLSFALDDVGYFHWHLWCLVSELYSKIHISSPVMTRQSKSVSVLRSSMMSWHTCMQSSFWSSFRSPDAIFAQIFHMPKSLVINLQTVLFHIQLICDHSNSQLTIAMQHLSYLLNVDLSHAYWRPLSPGISFHLLTLLFKPLVPLQNIICPTWCYLHILLKHFMCLWQFPKLDQKFQFNFNYSIFIILSSVPIAEGHEKEEI